MIISRAVSFVFRGIELVFALIVVGIVGHLLMIEDETNIGPDERYIYTEVIGALSVILSVVWLIPFTWSFMHYPVDLIISFAWFASFGVLYNWIHNNGFDCRPFFRNFRFNRSARQDWCDSWKAAESFAFLSALVWLLSALLSIHVYHRVRDRTGARSNV